MNRQLGKSPLNTSTKPIEYFIPLQQIYSTEVLHNTMFIFLNTFFHLEEFIPLEYSTSTKILFSEFLSQIIKYHKKYLNPKIVVFEGKGGWWSVNRQLGKSPLNTSTKPIEYFIPLQQIYSTEVLHNT